MPFNGSGVFQRVRNWVADATAGIKIRADYHDAEDDGFAAGLTNCITRDGQSIVTQNIPMNSKRLTGLEDPVNDQDAATKKYTDVKVTAGGKLTGDLEIEKDHPQLVLDDTDASGADIVFQHMGKTRWIVRMNADAESGSGNTGSNFEVQRYADDGTTMLGKSQVIDRASGRYSVNGDIYSVRTANTGVVFLGSDSGHYLFFDGTQYTMPSAKLTLGGQGTTGNDAVTFDQLATKQNNLGWIPVQQDGAPGMLGNKVYIGWNGSKLIAQVDNSALGAFVFGTSAIVSGGRLAIASDVLIVNTPAGGMYEPYGGAVVTGYQWANAGYPVITVFRYRWVQLLIGGTYYTMGISN